MKLNEEIKEHIVTLKQTYCTKYYKHYALVSFMFAVGFFFGSFNPFKSFLLFCLSFATLTLLKLLKI